MIAIERELEVQIREREKESERRGGSYVTWDGFNKQLETKHFLDRRFQIAAMKLPTLLLAIVLSNLHLSSCFSPSSSSLHAACRIPQCNSLCRLSMHSWAESASMQRRSFLASAASAGLLLISAPPRSGAEGLVGAVTVVGADSYVGGDVLRMLLEQKMPVTACVSPTSSISIPGDSKLLTVRKCDLMDVKEVSEVVRNSGTVIYAVEPRFRALQQEAVDLKEAADRPEGSSMEVTGLSNVAKACLEKDVEDERTRWMRLTWLCR